MLASSILENLAFTCGLSRGVSVFTGHVLQYSFDNYINRVICSQVNFSPDKSYLEIRRQSVSPDLWDVFENCDGYVKYDFGEYRYLLIED